MDGFTTAQGYVILAKASFKQKDKFSQLKKTQNPTDTIDKKKVVVNISKNWTQQLYPYCPKVLILPIQ
jgi:hypothetical protein